MPQLVGRNCAHCQQRISSEADGRFCRACGSPIHTACLMAAGQRDGSDACADCGASAAVAAHHREAAVQSQRAEAERARRTANGPRRKKAGWAVVTFAAYTAFCALYLLAKLASSNAAQAEVFDAAVSLGLAVVGLAVASAVWLYLA